MNKLEETRKLMHEFSRKTGLTENEGDIERRYLWTDAFAVQTFFGLAHACKDESFKDKAIQLIDIVHESWGDFILTMIEKAGLADCLKMKAENALQQAVCALVNTFPSAERTSHLMNGWNGSGMDSIFII